MKIFYLCWQPDKSPNNYPMKKHDTPDEAEKEAVRIARIEDKPVHVMELRATVRIETKIKWEYPDETNWTNEKYVKEYIKDFCAILNENQAERPVGCGCADLVCTCKK